MFLIEYDKNKFINAELINWLSIDSVGAVSVTLAGETETMYKVDASYAPVFVNNVQAMNHNGPSIECRYLDIIDNPQPSNN